MGLSGLSAAISLSRETPPSRPDAPVEDSKYTAVLVKRDGQWLLDRVTEEDILGPRPSNYEHLKELAWMIGSWVDDNDPDANIHTDCEWTKNRNFITRAFAVVIGDQVIKLVAATIQRNIRTEIDIPARYGGE